MDYTFEKLNEKNLDSTIKCAVKIFLYEEPMTRILGISENEFKKFITIVCKKYLREKLSYVCKKENNIVGFCLNEDLIEENPDFNNITEKMNPIFNILGKLDSDYLRKREKEKNHFFHLFMTGLLAEHRNKGIVKKLIEKSLIMAKKKNFKIAITEATNAKSQNLLKKFNFEEKNFINYSDFKFDNNSVFKNIGEKNCKLMELKLK